MFSYSLKELLYWLAVWIAALCAIFTAIPTPFGRILLAVWFIGTTVLNKAFGYRSSFWYACIFGIIFWLLTALLFPSMTNLILQVPLFGLSSGAVIWLVALCFDKLYAVRMPSR